MLVLGIETSCDETGVALYDSANGLLGHELFSQVDIHAVYGGVVPELAARDHLRKLPSLLNALLKKTGVTRPDIDAVAYTAGPGLMGALLVGTCSGRSIAYALGVPAIAVHHMEAHLLAPMIDEPQLTMPFLALLVSGGHTQLVAVDGLGTYRLLGDTLDDAAGEAFDKTATMLGLGYPGGPQLAALAEGGDPARYRFTRPMTDRPGLDFSFSGLKTQVLTTAQRLGSIEAERAHLARGFEEAVVDTLVIKCRRALEQTGMKRLVLAGGVAANKRLRSRLTRLSGSLEIDLYYPPLEFCTDNGAMIAYAGCQRLLAGESADMKCGARARWPLQELLPPG